MKGEWDVLGSMLPSGKAPLYVKMTALFVKISNRHCSAVRQSFEVGLAADGKAPPLG